jgi:hypothetical protein
MISSAQRLAREGLTMVEFPQTVTESSQNLFDLVKGRNLLVYPSPTSGSLSVAPLQLKRREVGELGSGQNQAGCSPRKSFRTR